MTSTRGTWTSCEGRWRAVVIGPEDAEYDAARRCYNALVDRRPAVIACCVGSSDVATAFAFARAHDLEVAVRGGGHNPAGHCVLDGGLVIDLTLMRTVEADGDAGIARADGGATWLDFDTATQGLGLVTPGGVVGSTGVAGLSFGGGIGHLTAQHGLTCDNLVGAEVVTPDGTVVSRERRRERRAALGTQRRRRQLRRGDAPRVPAVSTRARRRRSAHLPRRGRREGLRRFREVVAGSPRDLSCQVSLSVDESMAPVLSIAPCYSGPERSPTSYVRCARAQRSSTTP